MRLRLATGLLWVALGVATLALQVVGNYERTATYQDDMVVRCPDKNKPTVKVLRAHADVWRTGKEDVDVRVNKKTFARVQNYFPECTVLVANVEEYMQEAEAQMFPEAMAEEQAWVQEVMKETLPKCNLKQCEEALAEWEHVFEQSTTWFQKYHPYEKIKEFYRSLAKDHSRLVRYVESIGKTEHGRDMPAVHITATKSPRRLKFYMQCQIHAREWITGSVCMYIAQYLATQYNKDSNVTHLLNNMEFVMIPIVNPDGIAVAENLSMLDNDRGLVVTCNYPLLQYTWSNDRLWRKNRKLHSGAKCPGVDINRNFPLGFVHKKAEKYSCAEDFGGPNALSEKEAAHIVKYFRQNAPIVGAIDWHSYGQLLLRPYGYSNRSSPDERFLAKLSQEISAIAQGVHGQYYTPERSEQLYPCYGIAADWLYSNDAARTNKGYRPASICIELRDKTGHYGFVLPANQILPTAQEITPAFIHFAKTMLKHPLKYTLRSSLLQPAFDEKQYTHRRLF